MSTAKEAPVIKELSELGLENYEIETIARGQLVDAPYNPRIMTEAEKRKLKNGLKRHGLVAPITWNKRTGHIVGGHQRINALDSLAGTSTYNLRVAAIDVDESREKELNILLNNPNAQGDWLLPELKAVMSDPNLNLDGMGFDKVDLFYMFGSDVTQPDGEEALDKLAEQMRTQKEKYEELASVIQEKGREDYYIVVVFRDANDREQFLKSANFPDNRYQSGEELRRITGIERPNVAE